MKTSRNERRLLAKENKKYPLTLKRLPFQEWPNYPDRLAEVWRSKDYLVQVYQEENDIERLSICRSQTDGDRWADGITWNTLQDLKRQCGRGERDAIEIYPADRDMVNVANMRHLWLTPEPVAFAWRKSTKAGNQ